MIAREVLLLLPGLRARRAFNLLELMICLSILATGIILSIGIFSALLKNSVKSGDRTTGAMQAESALTTEIHTILASTGLKNNFFNNDAPPNPPINGTVLLAGTIFTYRIEHQVLKDAILGTPIGNGLANNKVAKTDVTVWWWTDDPTHARAGMGYQTARLTRFLNYNGTN
jgi:prepilin-type N-terminal cleavage/methylation domain-containing protein